MRHITPRLKAGIEINPLADEVGLVANFRLLDERERRPAVILGTSSDRIGTPAGQSYFVTFSKSFERELGWPVAPYLGASWSGAEDRLVFPFGASFAIGGGWSGMVMNDGVHTHGAVTYSFRAGWSVTLLAVRFEDVGVTVGVRF